MSTVKKFEDLQVWQKSRAVNVQIYKLSNKNTFSRDFALRDQIRRAAISIVSNIAEGFERNGNKEFNQFLSIAKGSAGEIRAQLYIAKDLEYITEEEFNDTMSSLAEVSKMLSGLMNYLRITEMKGSKFMEDEAVYGEL